MSHNLPRGFEVSQDARGRAYYVDHNTKTTSYNHPITRVPTPQPMVLVPVVPIPVATMQGQFQGMMLQPQLQQPIVPQRIVATVTSATLEKSVEAKSANVVSAAPKAVSLAKPAASNSISFTLNGQQKTLTNPDPKMTYALHPHRFLTTSQCE